MNILKTKLHESEEEWNETNRFYFEINGFNENQRNKVIIGMYVNQKKVLLDVQTYICIEIYLKF